MTMRPISRRQLLRGSGAALALPLLECMQRTSRGATESDVPRRAAFFYVPNGVVQSKWKIQDVGTQFTMSPTLAPLTALQDKVAVFSGYDRIKVSGTDGHAQASTCWLSSAPHDQLSPAGYPLDRTLDQVIADTTSEQTPFRSLELSCNPYRDNKESVYFDNISWYGYGHVARSLRDPQRVFQRLFEVQPEAESRSVLDLVLADAKSFGPRLGRTDRRKLDEYMQAVRTVEAQITRLTARRAIVEKLRPARPRNPWPELRRGEYIQLMGDLMILALRTDLTRVTTMMVAPERWGTPQTVEGVFEQPIVHHSMTHEQGNPEVSRKLALLDRFHVAQFARLVAKMDAVKEGAGTLLDSILFTFGSGLSSGKTHVYSDLPVVIAGGGRGTLATGRHHRAPEGTPVGNLWLAVAQAMGCPRDSFADSNSVTPLA
ncbi:MAG: hypothetical protein CMJ75_04855 [Planctomycetaceae bacterium]|nr:hypothetical protein [Planctomycetaceae bacterium]